MKNLIVSSLINILQFAISILDKFQCKPESKPKSIKQSLLDSIDPGMLTDLRMMGDKRYIEVVFRIYGFTPRNRIHANQIWVLAGNF